MEKTISVREATRLLNLHHLTVIALLERGVLRGTIETVQKKTYKIDPASLPNVKKYYLSKQGQGRKPLWAKSGKGKKP